MVTTYSSIADEIKNISWKYASENIDNDLHTDILFMETSVSLLKKVAGISYSHGLLLYKGHKGRFYFPDEEAQHINKTLIYKLKNNLSWGEQLNKNIVIKSAELENIWKPYLNYHSFAMLSDDKIVYLYDIQLRKHYELYQYGWIPEILQDTEYGIDYWITSIARKYNSDFTQKDILTLLPDTLSHTVYYKHDRALLSLIQRILANKEVKMIFSLPPKYIRTSLPYHINSSIRQLVNHYGYLGYHGYDERRPYDFNYYLNLIKRYVENEDELATFTKRLYSPRTPSILWEKLAIDEKRLLHIYHNWGMTKSRRRMAQLRNFYFLDMLIEEIAFRHQIPEDYIRFMTPAEVKKLLLHHILPPNIDKRSSSCLCYLNERTTYICNGDYQDEIFNTLSSLTETPVVLRGSIACGGFQIGKACLIERKSDFFNEKVGNNTILVTREADPDIFCIFEKIKAIVTDQGGITCHVASLAREYGIPCIVGTRFATEKIAHGDTIEVDAIHGSVRILERNNKS